MSPRSRWCVGVLLGLTFALPGVALGQGQGLPPSSNPQPLVPNTANFNLPHPVMPWAGLLSVYPTYDAGQVVGYIPVPPQPVTIEVLVPTPESLPTRMEQQVVEIPGYVVTETTTGYFVPDRWTLAHLNVGVYQWRRLPRE